MTPGIIERLRSADFGWTGDAVCVDGDTAAEGAEALERAYSYIVKRHEENPVQDWACRQCVGHNVIVPKGYEGPEFVCTPHVARAALLSLTNSDTRKVG